MSFTQMSTCEKDGMQEEMCGRVENITCIISPPHCLSRKCQKLNQFSNSGNPTSSSAPKEYCQQWIFAYQAFTLSKEMAFLYPQHNVMCSHISSLICCFVYPRFDSNEKTKFSLYRPLVRLDLQYHKQFELCSNWPKCHQQ